MQQYSLTFFAHVFAVALVAIALSSMSFATERTLFGSIKNNNQFSDPDPHLDPALTGDFQLGNALFRKMWSTNSSSVPSADGAGPLFNSRSCQRCHLKDGRGNPPVDDASVSASLVFQIVNGAGATIDSSATHINANDETYGKQIQPFAANGLHGEANIFVRFEPTPFKYSDGATVVMHKPHYRIETLHYGDLSTTSSLSPRVAPPMIGLGLLEAIPESAIRSLADPDDQNQDGISGRPNFGYSLHHRKTMLGRFGWKASAPTIIDQASVAFSVDMGLSTPLLLANHGDCTDRQPECIKMAQFYAGQQSSPEVTQDMLDLVVFYSQNLKVPAPRNTKHPKFIQGQALFNQVGCQSCHVPEHSTGDTQDISPHLRNRQIRPYTDLLLHDMGPELADVNPQGFAQASEWRTTPLWGLGLTKTVNPKARFLHDGRAATVEEAILWHGGESARSQKAFTQLSAAERDALLFFLNQL